MMWQRLSAAPPAAPLKRHLEARPGATIALDEHGLIIKVGAAVEAIFDDDINIKGMRLWFRDAGAMAWLNDAIDQLKPCHGPLIAKTIYVPRQDKSFVAVHIWEFDGAAHLHLKLESKPGPPRDPRAKPRRPMPSKPKVPAFHY